DGRRRAADPGRVSRRAPRPVRSCRKGPVGRAREPAGGGPARGTAAAIRGCAAGGAAARRQSSDHLAGVPGEHGGLGARRSRTGVTIAGPAILAGRDATALIEPEWRGTVHPCGAVLVERT